MNVDVSTVKRHLQRLRKDGFITWKGRKRKDGGQASNEYDLSGLVAKVQEFATEELSARKAEQDTRTSRRKKKRPSLRLVRGEQ